MGTRPECFMAPYARRVKEAVSVPVSTVGRIMPPEDGYEYKRVITPAGTPRKIVVIGGGLVGAETAEYIAQGDCEVTIVEMMGQIAAEESSTVKPFIMEDFTAHNVVVKTNTKVDRITADAVEATETLNPPAPAGRPGAPAPTPAADVPEPQTQAISIPCDCVVIASGTAPVAFDTAALEAHGIKVTLVGDCNDKAADINRAVEEGYLAATAA